MDKLIAQLHRYLAGEIEGLDPPPTQCRIFLEAALEVLFSPDICLARAVAKLGLDETVRLLAKGRGSPAVRAALAKIEGRPEVHSTTYSHRHALNLFCRGHGLSTDLTVAHALVPIFTVGGGERRSPDAMYRLLRKARRVVEADEVALDIAQIFANKWLRDHRGNDLSSGLRRVAKQWKSTPPF